MLVIQAAKSFPSLILSLKALKSPSFFSGSSEITSSFTDSFSVFLSTISFIRNCILSSSFIIFVVVLFIKPKKCDNEFYNCLNHLIIVILLITIHLLFRIYKVSSQFPFYSQLQLQFCGTGAPETIQEYDHPHQLALNLRDKLFSCLNF